MEVVTIGGYGELGTIPTVLALHQSVIASAGDTGNDGEPDDGKV
jgi:hypothetical protein